jgi:TIR domain
MTKHSGPCYPNGKTKSWLLETFLRPVHFGCAPEDYRADVAFTRVAEAEGREVCEWTTDKSGRMLVDGLSLVDRSKRLAIGKDGFQFVPWKVFISYAREDSEAAERLFRQLTRRGANPWMDTKSLKPGARWQSVIEGEIERCSHFIALLSCKSVTKRGFVHTELRRALKVVEELPERQIFVIPARLDECPAPHPMLERLHRVDLFPSSRWRKGVDEIVTALLSDDDA